MKKVLFATTALVLSAGVAAAEVSLSGDGRMGVVYDGDNANFNSRARVKFTLSGESDSGLAFGGAFRVDQEDEKGGSASQGAAGSVFVSGAFGRVEMGDVVGAPEALFGDFYEVGYTDLDGNGGNDIGYLTGDSANFTENDNPELLYTYSTGPVSLAASFSDGTNPSAPVDGQEMAIAGAYTWTNYTFGAGYEYIDGGDTGVDAGQVDLAMVAALGATNVKVFYATGTQDSTLDNNFGIGADYTMDAWTFGGYVQYTDLDGDTFAGDTAADNAVWYGVGASYDLGGGLSVKGGIADSDLKDTDMIADLGMKFSF
ncbi:porin [Thioclava sp. GXIMD2076]|uniref:porin n=1 Tax=Thioclava sp. GXIMD2076 TaxID=3131931 RepID=UPI0030D2BB35